MLIEALPINPKHTLRRRNEVLVIVFAAKDKSIG